MNLDGVLGDSRKRLEAADAALRRPWDTVATAPTYWPKPATPPLPADAAVWAKLSAPLPPEPKP